jgi:hypothetical protein
MESVASSRSAALFDFPMPMPQNPSKIPKPNKSISKKNLPVGF